ncbi:MAG: TylF/MycF family methyltransferase [Candidatus Omnitrophica bacterium]|nr:TylF/MycF family methyltransferase [Candidatus Omnitrophota bacterium]
MSYLFGAKKYLKKAVMVLQKILPKTIFDKFYSAMFPKYKTFVRKCYGAKSLGYRLSGNSKALKMVKDIQNIMPYTLVGIGGLEATYRLSKMVNEKGIKGSFVELGVARGGCAALMAGIAFEQGDLNRQMWLFDSFEGLPDPTQDDYQSGEDGTGDHVRPLSRGECLGTLEEVKDLFLNKCRFPEDKVFFVKGWFQDTLPLKGKEVGDIAVLRIDGDWYESTKCCLEQLYDRVVSGGAVIIDDYQSCYGCKKAVDEFLLHRDLDVDISLDGRGGCFFIKSDQIAKNEGNAI